MSDLLKDRLAVRQPPPAHWNVPPKTRWKILRAWSGEPPDPDAHLPRRTRALLFIVEMVGLALMLAAMTAVWMTKPWFMAHLGVPFGDYMASLRWSADFPFIVSAR